MALPAFIAPVLSFIFSEVVAKFIVLAVIYVVITFVIPAILEFVNFASYNDYINQFFTSLPDFMHYLLTVFRFDFGIPLFFSALITRWLIKRLPFVG